MSIDSVKPVSLQRRNLFQPFLMAVEVSSLRFLIILLAAVKLLALAEGEEQFIYNGFQGVSLELGGIAKIHPNGLLQLTNTSKQQIGRAFFPHPLKFNTSSGDSGSLSFSTIFAFAMVPELEDPSGHGVVFTIAPSMDFPGAVASQYFGLFNPSNNGLSSNHVFAVELDTILSPEMKDVNENHVGVDVNGLVSKISAPVTYFSNKEEKNKSLELISGKAMQVWIDYDDVQKLLHVKIAPLESPKPSMPLLSTSINLSSILLESMYVGFSSATGAIASDHYILGWSFNRSGEAQSLEISELPSLPPRKEEGKQLDLIALVSLIAATVVLIMLMGALCIIRRIKFQELREEWEREYGPQRFSYKDLYKATKGFHDKQLLGAGGFGKVYRGRLPSSNLEIAVKKVSHDSKQGMREFVAEIASMGRLRHRNLVQLLGYCRRRGELLLVYDHMPNGSLDKFLFSDEDPSLSWPQRYHILRGVASGLLYLHEEWEQVVLHRDVKASNVLLDANLNGRLGDFGLAKLYDHDANPQTTHIVGTVGYLAPELTRTGKATSSTDVFSFGAFMLETACGRRPVQLEGGMLVDWVLEYWKRGVILLASDPRLEGNYIAEEMELVLKLGLLCSNPMPAARPSMRQVMQYLDGDATLPEIPHNFPSMGTCGVNNEESAEFIMSFPSSSGRATVQSFSSFDSILNQGR